MYMDDIQIFAKNEQQLELIIQTIRICSQDRRIDFGIGKYGKTNSNFHSQNPNLGMTILKMVLLIVAHYSTWQGDRNLTGKVASFLQYLFLWI